MTRPTFPRTLPEFVRRFSSEDACRQYLFDSRWPDGFYCPKCGNMEARARKDRPILRCTACGKEYSATAGTVMHRSKQPLCNWLWAAYLVVTDKRGLSAVQLQQQLGIERYETAFNMLHKLRAAMVNPAREKLHGMVEVDETFIGGPKPGKRGRGAEGKALVVGAVEVRTAGSGRTRPGRLRLKRISGATRRKLEPFVKAAVERGSLVVTDGHKGYANLSDIGYSHEVHVARHAADPDAVLRHLHTAFSNLKTWLMGTHHGAVSAKHLQAYLNEFAFRFNRRGNLQAAFQTLLGITALVEGPTYRGLYEGTFKHKNPRKGPMKP